MASSRNFSNMLVIISIISLVSCIANAQLSANFYATSCPNVQTIVNSAMTQAVNNQPRIAASILRLFFHDCFVNGCDASLLLNATNGEQFAIPNNNSARGFDVIDTIKSQVEVSCNGTVSCADILALAARDGVVALGGPTWTVQLGRRDSTTASQSTANSDIPAPFDDLSVLIKKFSDKGLDAKDMTALSGGHTIGQAQCRNFRAHIYNDSDISASFGTNLQANCPATAPNGDSNLAPLDTQTSTQFDNSYYQNLVSQQGLLHSDQELFNGGSQDSLVTTYSNNQATFFSDFAAAMVKMGNISPLTGTNGEIRQFCGVTN